MSFTRDDIRQVAKLAALDMSDQELDSMAGPISDIVDFADKLQQVDTEGVEPTSHVGGLVNAFREDEVKESFDTKELEVMAPDFNGGYFRVKKII